MLATWSCLCLVTWLPPHQSPTDAPERGLTELAVLEPESNDERDEQETSFTGSH